MSDEDDDLFGPPTTPTQKIVSPSTPERIIAALAGYEKSRQRKPRARNLQPKKVFPPEEITSLSQLTADFYHPDPLKIFPNASQLGLDSELTIYAMYFGYFLTAKGYNISDCSQQNLREALQYHFLNNHLAKAYKVADLLYSVNGHDIFKYEKPHAVIEITFDRAHQDHTAIQLGLEGFEIVNYHPQSTLDRLSKWADTIQATASFTDELFFEVMIHSHFSNRLIRHPFDIVTLDMSEHTRIIELSNQALYPYSDRPSMLIEDALIELVADRILLGQYDQNIDLEAEALKSGAGEYWRIGDAPPQDPWDRETHLSDEDFLAALSLMQHATIHYGA